MLDPALYIVAVPIGNLEDITLRALRILSEVDVIACEDTRTSGQLLKKLNINYNKLTSYHEHNESEKSLHIIQSIKNGESVALISDAGTPLISDPGYKLVRRAREENLRVVPIPGVSSVMAALSASGMATDEFIFYGFPPQKKGRNTFLKRVIETESTMVIFESTHRIEKFVNELIQNGIGDRKICIAREITKMYEEFLYGTTEQILEIIKTKKGLKGEIVVVIDKKS